MRRVFGADNRMETFERMLREKRAIRLLLAGMPTGSTEADALRRHRRLRQLDRKPCSFLDDELGIKRP